MTKREKRELSKAITRLTKRLREFAEVNPRVLRNSTIYLHGFNDFTVPNDAVEGKGTGYRVWRVTDTEGYFVITLFD